MWCNQIAESPSPTNSPAFVSLPSSFFSLHSSFVIRQASFLRRYYFGSPLNQNFRPSPMLRNENSIYSINAIRFLTKAMRPIFDHLDYLNASIVYKKKWEPIGYPPIEIKGRERNCHLDSRLRRQVSQVGQSRNDHRSPADQMYLARGNIGNHMISPRQTSGILRVLP